MKKIDVGKLKKVRVITLVEDYAGLDTHFYAQHGVCFLIEAENTFGMKRILFDVGQCAESILHNIKILNIDITNINMIFLSHCHWDHTGGLVDILKEIRKEIPIISHPDIFRPTLKFAPGPVFNGICGISGENTINKIEEAKGKILLIKEPFSIIDGVLSTGQIEEKLDFEKELTLKGTYVIENGLLKEDDLHDEISLVLSISDALVIVVGCSHPGVSSIVNQAKVITGIQEVKAVIGGFHLEGASEQRIQNSVKYLKKIGVQWIFPGHCTGLRAECEFMKEFGAKFEKLYCGKIIEF